MSTLMASTGDRFAAPWHKISFERFLSTRLPALLAERLPISGYAVETESERTCRVTVGIGAGLELVFSDLPQPDAEGLFWLDGRPHIVIPIASNEELDKAEITCAGEQMYAYIEARLGHSKTNGKNHAIEWDESTARALLPLDAWFTTFLHATAQALDATNWNARTTHLRRLIIPGRTRVVAAGQMGRVDPFETPEGANIGRVFTVALGAEIRDGKLVITDNRPEATLGHNAAQVPFIEHDDANRLLMGVNMMRQALVPEQAEPALVQTGLAPANPGPDFWCGLNLLTAFISWGEASSEDGVVISETCARRLGFPQPAEPGDKLANRHGTKGVISQVLPDAQMPHLADGSPVEVIYSFSGLARRCVVGLVREAVMGRIAHAEGQAAIIPPFQAPSTQEIQARLVQNGLPESGMEFLRAGKEGPLLPYPSTVGWVYWYRLAHLARPKLRAVGGRFEQPTLAPEPGARSAWNSGQVFGELELRALRQAGAREIAREALTTCALRGSGEDSPYFQDLANRLAAAGIVAELVERRQVTFRFSMEQAMEPLKLAGAAHHPWLGEQTMDAVGRPPAAAGAAARDAFAALEQTNERLARWLAAAEPQPQAPAGRPSTYLKGLLEQLETRLADYLDALLPASALRLNEPQCFSASAVVSPAVGLRLDQVGLPGEILYTLFGVEPGQGGEALEQSWVIIHRAPALSPAAMVAFHPVLVDGPSIRLHPQACALLNADFDGDLVAVFRPLSQAAQREAGELLSVEGHLRRDPSLLPSLLPPHEGLWGLASLSLTLAGRQQIASLLGVDPDHIPAPLTTSDLGRLLGGRLRAGGPGEAVRAAGALAHLGYAASSASGASLSPFAASQVPLPPPPEKDDPEAWGVYTEICAEAILSGRDYANPNLGPQMLSAAIRPKERHALPYLVGPGGYTQTGYSQTAEGKTVIASRSLAEGRTAAGLFASVAGARQSLARLAFEGEEILQARPPASGIFTVIARARRARRPGIAFARAAASGEVDPLTDEETRILVGTGR